MHSIQSLHCRGFAASPILGLWPRHHHRRDLALSVLKLDRGKRPNFLFLGGLPITQRPSPPVHTCYPRLTEIDDNDALQRQLLLQTKAALAAALREKGLSQDESSIIASNAPFAVQDIVNAVLELDELSAWTSTSKQGYTCPDFEQKAMEIIRMQPGRTLSAFLESLGVGQRQISFVCHILASQELPHLFQRVKFLEEILPAEKDDVITLRIRRMMREISVSADEGLQRTLSFFEKMEAKRGGLNMLAVPKKAIVHLIEELPQLLLRDPETELRALLDFFDEIGVPKDRIAAVVMCYPSILLYSSIDELRRRLKTLKKQAFVRPKNFGMMVVKYPWIFSRSVEDNIDAVVRVLQLAKISPVKIGQSITKCPNLLGASTRSLQSMIHQMILIGTKEKKIGFVIAHSPQLLLKTPRKFLEITSFFENLGIEESYMSKLLVASPSLFASTVPLVSKKIKFLQQLGICDERLKMLLQRYPKVLMMSLEDSLKPRVLFLQSMGLSNRDIAFMICGFPALLGYSIDGVLKPKFEVLENVLCQSVKEVVLYPRYFSYNLQKKIIPRYRVLKRSKTPVNLKDMLSKSDDEFAEKYLGFRRMLVPPV